MMVTTMPLRSGQSMSSMAVLGVGGMEGWPQSAAQSGYRMSRYLGLEVRVRHRDRAGCRRESGRGFRGGLWEGRLPRGGSRPGR